MLELWNGTYKKKGGLPAGMVRSFIKSDGSNIIDLVGNNISLSNGTINAITSDSSLLLYNPASIKFPTTPIGNSLQLSQTDRDPNFQVGSNVDFCIEMWVRPRRLPSGQSLFALFSTYGTTRNNEFGFYRNNDFSILLNSYGRIYGYTMGTAISIINSDNFAVSSGSWNHIAVCRKLDKIRTFVGGVNTGQSNTQNLNLSRPAIGGVWSSDGQNPGFGTNQLDGNIDQFRFVIGDSVYWNNFTPEQIPDPT